MTLPRRRGNRKPKRRRRRLPTQREILRGVMLSAGKCGPKGSGWLTLEELSRITRFGEGSISAQLRHLRKRRYGAFVVEKRQRRGTPSRRAEQALAPWEYRVRRS